MVLCWIPFKFSPFQFNRLTCIPQCSHSLFNKSKTFSCRLQYLLLLSCSLLFARFDNFIILQRRLSINYDWRLFIIGFYCHFASFVNFSFRLHFRQFCFFHLLWYQTHQLAWCLCCVYLHLFLLTCLWGLVLKLCHKCLHNFFFGFAQTLQLIYNCINLLEKTLCFLQSFLMSGRLEVFLKFFKESIHTNLTKQSLLHCAWPWFLGFNILAKNNLSGRIFGRLFSNNRLKTFLLDYHSVSDWWKQWIPKWHAWIYEIDVGLSHKLFLLRLSIFFVFFLLITTWFGLYCFIKWTTNLIKKMESWWKLFNCFGIRYLVLLDLILTGKARKAKQSITAWLE